MTETYAANGFRNAVCVSPFTEAQLRAGPIGGATSVRMVQEVLRGDEIFARCNTTRSLNGRDDDSSFERVLERARLAVELDLPFNPEFGLWETYGDVTHQPAPDFSEFPQVEQRRPWDELRPDEMCRCLFRYGAVVAEAVLATGARVDVWDVGNEVELGTAGVACPPFFRASSYVPPDHVDVEIGRRPALTEQKMATGYDDADIAWLERHLWPHLGRLMGAFADGVRRVDADARFSTHLSALAVSNPAVLSAFFRTVRENGFAVDVCATSYYPTMGAGVDLDGLQRCIEALGEPLFVAEFAYPADRMTGMFSWNTQVDGYPLSAQGQADFYRDLCALPRVSGVRWWAPDLCRSAWGPMSMFTDDGTPRVVLTQQA